MKLSQFPSSLEKRIWWWWKKIALSLAFILGVTSLQNCSPDTSPSPHIPNQKPKSEIGISENKIDRNSVANRRDEPVVFDNKLSPRAQSRGFN